MQRYKLTIAYRGSAYYGWQFQTAAATWRGKQPPPGQGIPTIQQELAKAIVHVVRHPVVVCGSSRTDSGVHAKGQLAHFDSNLEIPPEGMRRGINNALPGDILVRHIEAVPDYFNAITSTTRKRYQYLIWNADDRPVFAHDMAWHRFQKLDLDAMRAAAAHLVGEHDFASFTRPHHRREHTIRTVFACDINYRAPRLVIAVEGNGFLWNMVRIIVGTLVQVGVGTHKPDDILTMLAAKDRRAGGATAPPHGLYLHWIKTKSMEQLLAESRERDAKSLDVVDGEEVSE